MVTAMRRYDIEEKAYDREQAEAAAKDLLSKSDFDSPAMMERKRKQHARIDLQSNLLLDMLLDLPVGLVSSCADLQRKEVSDAIDKAAFKRPISIMMLNVCLQSGASPLVIPHAIWQRLQHAASLSGADDNLGAVLFLLNNHLRLQAIEYADLLRKVVEPLEQCRCLYLGDAFKRRSQLDGFSAVIDVISGHQEKATPEAITAIRRALTELRVSAVDEANFITTYYGLQPMPRGDDTPREVRYVRFMLENIKAMDLSQLRRRSPKQNLARNEAMANIYRACEKLYPKACEHALSPLSLTLARP